MSPSFKNILIIRSDRIGDVVLTTPAIHALRKTYPDAKISVLVSSGNEILLEGHPDIDEVLIDGRKAGEKTITGFWQLVGMLKKRKFDCCINYHTKRRTNLAAFFAGIPVRIGYKNNKCGFLLTKPLKDERHLGQKHEVQYCLDVLTELSVDVSDNPLSLPVLNQYEKWFASLTLNLTQPIILIHPGASDPAKRWPKEKFVELINKIGTRPNLKVGRVPIFVLIGSGEVQKIAQQIEQAVDVPVKDLVGQTNLGQLMYLIYKSDLMISNDSGPVHIAAAYDTPVVSIFTRNQPGINPERWQPLGTHSTYVSVAPEDSMANEKAGEVPLEYLQLIDTESVTEAVDAIYKLC